MIKTIIGNPYQSFVCGDAICVTTNGIVTRSKKAVMGAGNAKIARESFPGIDTKLANYLSRFGNRVFNLGVYEYEGKQINVISFPTKFDWKDNSSLDLIRQSAIELKELLVKVKASTVYLPIPGCSNGKLKWSQVAPVLEPLAEIVTVFSVNSKLFDK